MSMREAGAGTNNFSLAHMRRERMDRLDKQVEENTGKLYKMEERDTPTVNNIEEAPDDDPTTKIQNAKSIAQEFKKQNMDGTEGSDFSTNLDEYD